MFSKRAVLKAVGLIAFVSVLLSSIQSFVMGLYWSYKETDMTELILFTLSFVGGVALSLCLGYAVYLDQRQMYFYAFLVSWILPALAVAQLISGVYVHYFGTEESLLGLGIPGDNVSTAAQVLAFAKIVVSAIPTVTFHLLWIHTPSSGYHHPGCSGEEAATV